MANKLNAPRLLVCAPSSSSGKTLITCALLRILQTMGFRPAAFKCGPDYIDPMFHKQVLGIPSRNIDLFLAGEDGVKRSLFKGLRGRDIGVLEGVMGFYDGMSPDSLAGSSYDISRITDTPAILVIDCRGMSHSILPMVKGFAEYGAQNRIKGIILNKISPAVSDKISDLILEEIGIPVIGSLPVLKDFNIASRHLGLVMPAEIPGLLEMIDRVAEELKKSLDVNRLLEIAKGAGELVAAEEASGNAARVRVGIARDEAFCFYYEDNLELLEEMGAELVFFSPLHDEEIPEVSGLIIGGGYPELFAKELSGNVSMRESIRKAAVSGMPMLAECGGFLYLLEGMADPDGNNYPMAGVFEGSSHMTDKLSRFGYVSLCAVNDTPFLLAGENIRGHEFHYYDTTDNGKLCRITKPTGSRSWKGYRMKNNVFAGFAHLYYPSCTGFIKRFLECLK